MNKSRIEAFSDGVIAIIITIMVLELKVPHGAEGADLVKLWPVFISYVLSFVNVGIYWNNHHHLMHTVKRVNGRILWANMHLLFWLSLVPFTTGWMGENNFSSLPVAVYAFNLLMCGVAYTILSLSIIKLHGTDSDLAHAIGADRKGKVSLAAYVLSIPLAMAGFPLFAGALIIAVAAMWFIPDRRIEQTLSVKE
jgi:uncharacterized membrane protein